MTKKRREIKKKERPTEKEKKNKIKPENFLIFFSFFSQIKEEKQKLIDKEKEQTSIQEKNNEIKKQIDIERDEISKKKILIEEAEKNNKIQVEELKELLLRKEKLDEVFQLKKKKKEKNSRNRKEKGKKQENKENKKNRTKK